MSIIIIGLLTSIIFILFGTQSLDKEFRKMSSQKSFLKTRIIVFLKICICVLIFISAIFLPDMFIKSKSETDAFEMNVSFPVCIICSGLFFSYFIRTLLYAFLAGNIKTYGTVGKERYYQKYEERYNTNLTNYQVYFLSIKKISYIKSSIAAILGVLCLISAITVSISLKTDELRNYLLDFMPFFLFMGLLVCFFVLIRCNPGYLHDNCNRIMTEYYTIPGLSDYNCSGDDVSRFDELDEELKSMRQKEQHPRDKKRLWLNIERE